MRQLHFSIRNLMAIVLYFAIGLASLRSGSVWWGVGLSMVAILAIATATLMAIANKGRACVSWAGFAIFGWSYILLGFPNTLENLDLRPLALALAPFEHLYPHINPDVPASQPISARLPYLWASHAILSMSFALLGSLIGRYIGDRGDTSNRE